MPEPSSIAITALENARANAVQELNELRTAVIAYFQLADANTPVGRTRPEWEASSTLVKYVRDNLREMVGLEPREPFFNFDDESEDD